MVNTCIEWLCIAHKWNGNLFLTVIYLFTGFLVWFGFVLCVLFCLFNCILFSAQVLCWLVKLEVRQKRMQQITWKITIRWACFHVISCFPVSASSNFIIFINYPQMWICSGWPEGGKHLDRSYFFERDTVKWTYYCNNHIL